MAQPPENLIPALTLYRRGDLAGARAAAPGRAYIRTASYAQVAEPIYRRAAGWERYRDQMPWAERMGHKM